MENLGSDKLSDAPEAVFWVLALMALGSAGMALAAATEGRAGFIVFLALLAYFTALGTRLIVFMAGGV